MRIFVGSCNPIKVQAIREVLTQIFPDAEVESVDVESGVADQPIGLEETLRGAKNRATAAWNAGSGEHWGVALESGLVPVPETRTGYMNLTACAIYTGQHMAVGLGPAFELPDQVTELVAHHGMELDPAVRQAGLTNNARIGYSQGIIGILSQGRVTRMQYSKPAVSMALVALGL
ncbi:inosine/xanthosine triphosphatase [Desulfovibrionales bacterium]